MKNYLCLLIILFGYATSYSNNRYENILPEIECDFPIYQGGPVEQDNLYFIHKVPDLIPESIEVADGIFWGGNFESLKALLDRQEINENEIRFFLGYSGWGKHQLEDEIELESWFISENNLKNILEENENFWKEEILQKGGSYRLWANAPSNISLN